MREIKFRAFPSFYIPTLDPRLQIAYDSHSRAVGILLVVDRVNVSSIKNNLSEGRVESERDK